MVTIRDIAAQAGVSTATVSKVINDKQYVSPQTREKVLAVMERLNYAPNASAANLARRSSKTVLYADRFYKGLPYANPHMFDIICGVSHELSRKGYRLSLLNLDAAGKKPEKIMEEAVLSRVADGIILNCAFATPQTEKLMLRLDYPHICIGEPGFTSIMSWIDTNHTLSANLAVEHLLARGCRRLAIIGGQKQDKIFMERLRGFLAAAEKNSLAIPEAYIAYNRPDIRDIFRSVTELLGLPERPDGIVCTNSLIMAGALQAVKKADLKVPEEVSLIAFDDYPYSPLLYPHPTVIDIDLFSLGVQAGNFLLKRIKDPTMLIQTYTALPRLIQRDTTRA